MLNSEERRRRLPPEMILESLQIAPGDVAVDIGAGTGFWTLPLVRLVSPGGMVYAVDVEPVMLEDLTVLGRDNHLQNLRVVAATESAIPLPDDLADVAVSGFVLHEPDDRAAFVREIAPLLKPGGCLLAVDWHKKETEHGPPVQHRLPVEETEALLTGAGLTVDRVVSPNPDVYILIGRRSRA